ARRPADRRVGLQVHRRHADRGRAREASAGKTAAPRRCARHRQTVWLQTSRAAAPRVKFQTKLFLAAFSAAVLALAVAGVFFATSMRAQTDARIEQTLVAEARLAGELMD